MVAYDQVVARFADDPSAAVRPRVAMALVYKGITLVEVGRRRRQAWATY